MSKLTTAPKKITFNKMKGILTKTNSFLHDIADIDTSEYEYIYHLDNGWAGAYLLIKDINFKEYRFLECGSGVPITRDIKGSFK